MKKIHVLPPSVYNLLAAGEVVENPASVVKELVENSIDAGAATIEVAINTGGFESIRVTDNGEGVDEGQVVNVFLPHATSKIEKAADLEKIGSLGFRGEALASIASVSKIEFITKTANTNAGTKLILDAGKIIQQTKTSANNGTNIIVKNLFYNTPARKKFLKSLTCEKNNVTAVVQKLILGNPSVSFKYVIDDEVLYDFNGGGLKKAIEVIYGNEVKLIKVDARKNGLELHGFIGAPEYAKRNRTWQTMMVNGRVVGECRAADAVNEAAGGYMTVGSYPFFVLNLVTDPASVDVNIHPRKAAVRFSEDAAISEFVKRAVTDAVDAYFSEQIIDNSEQIRKKDEEYLQKIKHFTTKKEGETAVRSAPNIIAAIVKHDREQIAKRDAKITEQLNVKKPKKISQESFLTDTLNEFKIIGTLFDTYILVVRDERFFIIDQHAAAERLLYDDLRAQVDKGTVATQALLEPVITVVSPQEMNRVLELQEMLTAMGIVIEPFGNNCVRVTSVPVAVSERGIDTVITNILKEIKSTPKTRLSEVLQDKIITECCRASIKAGQSLNNHQIAAYLSQFWGKKIVPLCPHGRPILVSFTKGEIEKMFARK